MEEIFCFSKNQFSHSCAFCHHYQCQLSYHVIFIHNWHIQSGRLDVKLFTCPKFMLWPSHKSQKVWDAWNRWTQIFSLLCNKPPKVCNCASCVHNLTDFVQLVFTALCVSAPGLVQFRLKEEVWQGRRHNVGGKVSEGLCRHPGLTGTAKHQPERGCRTRMTGAVTRPDLWGHQPGWNWISRLLDFSASP